jgi:hypothetical protein
MAKLFTAKKIIGELKANKKKGIVKNKTKSEAKTLVYFYLSTGFSVILSGSDY